MEQWSKDLGGYVNGTAARLEKMLKDQQIDPRFSPQKLSASLEALLPERSGDRFYVLDVGCGYASHVGRRTSKDEEVVVVGIDVLAVPYLQVVQGLRLPAQHVTLPIAAEELNAAFPPGTFDLVVCRDALDGFVEPGKALAQMIQAVKPGGSVVVATLKGQGTARGFKDGKYWDAGEHDGILLMTDEQGTTIMCSRYFGVTVEAKTHEPEVKTDAAGTVVPELIRAIARKPAGGIVTA